MGLFKSKQEKQVIAEMNRDEQLNVFNEQLVSLKAKREEYAKLAAEAELNSDMQSYDTAVSSLIELSNMISSITQMKSNFDIINISNTTAMMMVTAINALDAMSSGNKNLPNIKNIQKANMRIAKYMRNVKITQKALSGAMKTSSPANKLRTQEEIDSVRPMIDAARSKMSNISTPLPKMPIPTNTVGLDLANEIQKEKNRII